METRYGIGINNRYALLSDSDDEGSNVEDLVIKKAQVSAVDPKKPAKTDAKMNGAPTAKKDATAIASARNQSKDKSNNREDKENRNSGKRPLDSRRTQENREDRNNRRNRDDGDAGRGGRGGRRGGGEAGRGSRGGRGGTGGNRGMRREFDRKSGDDKTGVKAVDKREGGGSFNWGTVSDDIKAEQDTANTSGETGPDSAPGADKDHDDSRQEEEPKEEEPKTLTLEEWKAQQDKKTERKFNLRKAGEGSDLDPKWKKAYAYKKEKETPEDEEEEDVEYYVSKNKRKTVLDIELTFTDANRGGPGGRGGRGGRGGPGGGRGGGRKEGGGPGGGGGGRGAPAGVPRGGDSRRGGAGRGGKGQRSDAPDVFDAESFPSLG